MEEEFTSLDMFDLLSNQHRKTRQAIENRWNKTSDLQLTDSEWFILDRINNKKKLLADVCKNGEITRQGTHKLIRKLEERGFVLTNKLENNKRSKYVQLTPLGISCYEENKKLKELLEAHIKHILGDEAYDRLKKNLAKDWQLENTF